MRPLVIRGETLTERAKKNLAILEAIRRLGPVSKTDISKLAGLNVVTVSNYIEGFLRSRLIFEKELDISAGGRRPILLDLNSDAGVAIGVGFNLMNMVAVATDLDGRIISRIKKERHPTKAKEIIDLAMEVIRELIEELKQNKQNIRGIGIGIGGIVNNKTGTICWPEKLSEKGCIYASIYFPLKDLVEKEFNLPCIIENDATVACFGEQWLSLEPEIENLIYMFSGVGCGIMINREIYRGTTGGAGEVSVYNSKEDDLFNCSYGNPCFLKRWEADLDIPSQAKQRIKTGKVKSKILELADNDSQRINLQHIIQAAKENDTLALDLIRIAGKRLGIKIAFLVNLLNPQVVIIGGGIEELGGVFLNTVRETVSSWAFEEMAGSVKIIPSRLTENSVALGAASLVVREVFAQL